MHDTSSITAETNTSTIERGRFSYGDETIYYEIIRKPESSKAKSRKVTIKIHPDQRVVATVPHDASDRLIHDAMTKQSRWIWQNLKELAKQKDQVLTKRYISGETQFYLGRRYVLKVITDAETNDLINHTVKLSRGKLNVTLSQSDAGLDAEARADLVKSLLDKWYKNKAKAVFKERLKILIYKAYWVTNDPLFKLIIMKKQWGSCSTKGNLIFNLHLVKAPKECIDYVILHELCHIAEHNHSERFWHLLTQVMPNWKAVKARLDGMAELYLNE